MIPHDTQIYCSKLFNITVTILLSAMWAAERQGRRIHFCIAKWGKTFWILFYLIGEEDVLIFTPKNKDLSTETPRLSNIKASLG